MSDNNRYGALVKRYIKVASDAGLTVSRDRGEWVVKPLKSLPIRFHNPSELIAYIRGYVEGA